MMFTYANAAAEITGPRNDDDAASASGTPAGGTTSAGTTNDGPALENEEPPAGRENTEMRTAATSGENFTVPASEVEPVPTGTRCRICPHGVYAAFPAIFGTLAWLATLSKNGCDYAKVSGPIVADITNNPDVPWIYAGFNYYREPTYENFEWVVDTTEPCSVYNLDVVNVGAAWNFAKVTAFLSLVLGGSGAIFIWFSTCFFFRKHTWRWAGYEMLAAVVLVALSFTWFATSICRGDNKCDMHYGSQVDIVACVLWTVATMFVLCKYPRERGRNNPSTISEPVAEPRVPGTEVEMTAQGDERPAGTATDEHEII